MGVKKNLILAGLLATAVGCNAFWGTYLEPIGEKTAEECGHYTCTKKGGTGSAWCYQNTKDTTWYECTAGSCPDGAIETMCAAVMADGGTNDGGNTIPDLDTTPTYNIGDKTTGAGPVKGKNGEKLVCVPYHNQPVVYRTGTYTPDLPNTLCEVFAPNDPVASHVFVPRQVFAAENGQNVAVKMTYSDLSSSAAGLIIGHWYRATPNTIQLDTSTTRQNGSTVDFMTSWLTNTSSTFDLVPPTIPVCTNSVTPGRCLFQ